MLIQSTLNYSVVAPFSAETKHINMGCVLGTPLNVYMK